MTGVDIQNLASLKLLLTPLSETSAPLWGDMNPQQMVEHLIDQVQYTNGVKTPVDTGLPPDFTERKQRWVYTDELIPKNVILGELPAHFIYLDLETAKRHLLAELVTFNQYHQNNPGLEVLHGGFGHMTFDEWTKWHNKHFTHHFKQFGLIHS